MCAALEALVARLGRAVACLPRPRSPRTRPGRLLHSSTQRRRSRRHCCQLALTAGSAPVSRRARAVGTRRRGAGRPAAGGVAATDRGPSRCRWERWCSAAARHCRPRPALRLAWRRHCRPLAASPRRGRRAQGAGRGPRPAAPRLARPSGSGAARHPGGAAPSPRRPHCAAAPRQPAPQQRWRLMAAAAAAAAATAQRRACSCSPLMPRARAERRRRCRRRRGLRCAGHHHCARPLRGTSRARAMPA